MHREKLWTKDFTMVSTINFLLTLVFYLLIVIIGSHAVEAYGATLSEVGLVTGLFVVGTLLGRLFTGRAIDRVGRKKTLIVGLILFTLATTLYFVQIGIGFLIFARFLHGAMLGIASTGAGTIVAQVLPSTRRAEGIGYYSTGATLATATGPFIGMYMMKASSSMMIFVLCLMIGLAALVMASFLQVPAMEMKQAAPKNNWKFSSFVEVNAVPISMITLIIAIGYAGLLSFFNLYAEEANLEQAASVFFVVYAFSILLSRPFTGPLIDRMGANIVMYPTFALYGGGMILLAFAQNGAMLLTAAVLIGLGFGNMQSSIQAIAIQVTPPERVGLATSTFYIFLDAGLGLGPYLLGFIVAMMGYRSLYVMLGTLILFAAVLYYFLHGRKDREVFGKLS